MKRTSHSYTDIDIALRKESEFRKNAEAEVSKFKAEKTDILKKKIIALLIAMTVISVTLYLLSKYRDGFDLIFPIASTLAVALSVIFSHTLTSSCCEEISAYRSKVVGECEYKVIANYVNSFYSKNIYTLLHIPNDIIFDDSDFPQNSTRSYKRYISSTGQCYHKKWGCSNATIPIHLFELNSFRYKRLRRCSICALSDSIMEVPDWYGYYLKIKAIDKQYKLNIDYNNPISPRSTK